MSIRRPYLLACLAVAGLSADLCAAHAGALLEAPGTGELITTTSFSSTTRYFDSNGKLVPIAAYEKFELASYLEYGLTERLTLIGRPAVSNVPTGAAEPRTSASADLGGRLGLFAAAATAISMQDQFHLPARTGAQQNYILDDETIFSNELSLLLTRTFTFGGGSLFADAAGGYRWQSRGLPNEWHVDATLGLRPDAKWLWLVQTFATIASTRGPFGSYAALKIQLSAVYDFTAAYSLQIGIFQTMAARNYGREIGPLAGFWYRF